MIQLLSSRGFTICSYLLETVKVGDFPGPTCGGGVAEKTKDCIDDTQRIVFQEKGLGCSVEINATNDYELRQELFMRVFLRNLAFQKLCRPRRGNARNG